MKNRKIKVMSCGLHDPNADAAQRVLVDFNHRVLEASHTHLVIPFLFAVPAKVFDSRGAHKHIEDVVEKNLESLLKNVPDPDRNNWWRSESGEPTSDKVVPAGLRWGYFRVERKLALNRDKVAAVMSFYASHGYHEFPCACLVAVAASVYPLLDSCSGYLKGERVIYKGKDGQTDQLTLQKIKELAPDEPEDANDEQFALPA